MHEPLGEPPPKESRLLLLSPPSPPLSSLLSGKAACSTISPHVLCLPFLTLAHPCPHPSLSSPNSVSLFPSQAVQALLKNAPSTDKTMKIIKDGYHEVGNTHTHTQSNDQQRALHADACFASLLLLPSFQSRHKQQAFNTPALPLLPADLLGATEGRGDQWHHRVAGQADWVGSRCPGPRCGPGAG
jgi:hypothetical protein